MSALKNKKRLVTGIKSSGILHIGNYLGAIKPSIELQKDYESFIFIADLHSLTTVHDKKTLQNNILNAVLDYLACGLDPKNTIFYRQSDIHEHSELSWILSCITPFGLMERAHAWKDAISKKLKDPTIGLFTYPVLMSADILLYEPDIVPVGKDQKQHVEIARDLAEKFNYRYGQTFKLPKVYSPKQVETIIGTDGEHKMSKSYGNIISMFSEPEIIKKQIMKIKTDSTLLKEPKNPDTDIVYKIYSHFATPLEISNLKDKYLAGGYGYGEAKQLLLRKLTSVFEPMRQKRIELANNLGYLDDILKEGAKKAGKIASQKLAEVKEKTGLVI